MVEMSTENNENDLFMKKCKSQAIFESEKWRGLQVNGEC